MDLKVKYINLSLYARATEDNECISKLIDEAIDAGITVIGAAGNDNEDASNYVPGNSQRAIIAGSMNNDGTKRKISNFGETVDYYVRSQTTSEATARLTGWISAEEDLKKLEADLIITEKLKEIESAIQEEISDDDLPTNVYRPYSDLSDGRWKDMSDEERNEYYKGCLRALRIEKRVAVWLSFF